jgi:hypothetical protein
MVNMRQMLAATACRATIAVCGAGPFAQNFYFNLDEATASIDYEVRQMALQNVTMSVLCAPGIRPVFDMGPMSQ